MYEDDSHLLMNERELERAEELKRGDQCEECGSAYEQNLGGDNGLTLICSNVECRYELDLVEYVRDRRSGYDDDF